MPSFSIEGTSPGRIELEFLKTERVKSSHIRERDCRLIPATRFPTVDDLRQLWLTKFSDARVSKLRIPPVGCFSKDTATSYQPKPSHDLSLLADEAWAQNPPSKYGWRVIRIEPVLRSDLYSRFMAKQDAIRTDLSLLSLADLEASVPYSCDEANADINAQKVALAGHLTQTRISYHGTRTTILPEIIVHGFLKPGSTHPASGEKLKVDKGSTYGSGVYTTPNPHLALTYSSWDNPSYHDLAVDSPIKQIIVCGTVLGRAANVRPGEGSREATSLKHGARRRVANGGEEWILKDEDQVLPIFVVSSQWYPESSEEISAYADYARRMALRKEREQEDGHGEWTVF